MGDFDQQIEAFANQLERQAERDAERADRKARAEAPQMTAEESERHAALATKRKSLELARARVVHDIDAAAPGRYREQLERSLAALDDELGKLDA